MESLMVVLVCLILGILFQSVFHRILRRRHTVSMRTSLIYVCIYIPLIAGLLYVKSDLILSSVLLYTFTASLLSFLYLGVVLGGETPSSMMLHALGKRKHMTEKELIQLFSVDVLVWKRIKDLENSGLVSRSDGLMRATKRGYQFVEYISLYERVFHRSHGG